MLEELKEKVLSANLLLKELGLVCFTWGNVSGIDRQSNLVVIKPSGVHYDKLSLNNMVVVDMDGNIIEGGLRPSSDLATHLELYKKYQEIGGVVHTHSRYATSFAQCRKQITAFGTTHADYFYGDIPCTRALTKDEVEKEYEKNTGKVIIETLGDKDVMKVPAILVSNHGPFIWGLDSISAVMNAAYLEESARMAFNTLTLDGSTQMIDQYLLDKHYQRKHGKNAYYGQKEKK
ncbi:L-ribulose-5-phosphate 4-epimerase [Clostridium omnivorum]|uniref:L-ribulose-5-phosphate 4-epimerase UlaF n=1 Tax=Clostridium omnivorum TaxID=1604902 RepID=A0ABQ5N211_9CLOT|nr:L-ribulose-5-phosphate 4-epimerase [Clostridium sp. E14]GLC29229.1 L-ribulose-5-phosphate 4-epimerase UlaF [Clostridium sp. E14]